MTHVYHGSSYEITNGACRRVMTSSNENNVCVTGPLCGDTTFHRSPVDSQHKGQRRGTLMFSLICAWTNDWANNWDTGYLRRHRAHYDFAVMRKRLLGQLSSRWGKVLPGSHYSDVKWPSWRRLELPVYRVFVQQFLQINKETSKVRVIVPLCGESIVHR